MKTEALCKLTLKDAVQVAGKEGAESVIRAVADRIQTLNPKVNAYLEFHPDKIFTAKTSSEPLHGVPISVKDNICVNGFDTTCASKILRGFTAPYDATVIEKLKGAGASLIGRCNMDEFAFGSSSETSAGGPVRNPWNLEYVPGGSSGGSAAAVAADMAMAALGSDTGGSIRQPAAFCGVVGLKPTYGRVSRYGLIAFGSSFDQVGPITKTVEDSALLMNILSGHDRRDSTSAEKNVPDFTKALGRGVKGLRIGLPKEYFIEGLDPEVEKHVREAAKLFEKMGAVTKEISLPHTSYSVAVYYIVAVAEASSNLGRYDGVQYGFRAPAQSLNDLYFDTRDQGFGEEAKRRILLGTFVLSSGYYEAYYRKGQKVRTLIRRDFDNAFKEVDMILSPTAPTAAFKLGEKMKDPVSMYLSDIFTIPANLAGIPAISIPCGFNREGLPLGLQLTAKAFDEETLFAASHAFEQSAGFYKQKPKL